ncbi:MAG TPA: Holliday junction branch migration protein RuvA [Candidatus Saccharimonadales bacterium]|nr:Holliday junction branch migration protein RuvA [Candidatus Saccharimonadales bacterium]
MIATLNGVVSEKLAEIVVLDVQGMGYGLLVSAEDFGRLTVGESAKLYVYEHIREQSHDLYGFITRDNQNLFEQLLNVSGIGPKMALNVLSIGTAQVVRTAIASGDVKYLQTAVGIGRRAAERIVIELKDKVGLVSADIESTGLLQSESSLIGDEAAEALIALGYSAADAGLALKNIDPELPTPERIKQALKA